MILVNNLKFQYPKNESLTLKGISFEIKQGELFGFLGPSGAGKSTAQKVLYKTLSNYSGEVKIDGKDLNDWDLAYFEKIGVGFELPNHYQKLTGLENLDLFGSFYPIGKQRDRTDLFEMVGLQDAISKPVETYSKGMKMRLNFIRAIQHDPDILFFDEPTAGLDPVNAQMIRNHISDLQERGKTIFITTHSMHTADELCDRVAFIVEGELRITDSPETLKSQYGKEAVRVELKDGQSQEFSISDLGNNPEFIGFLKKGAVSRIHTMEATLDEVFINVTGKTLT
ncbi:ABC transporter ATP-binding protein [Rhodohalobacter sulfatireducens]|uniref:ABC transporter ATP-binding protein n=1 Tax=Rhodohalobacter sulfatireducens TaxID=2911366 RepID=A0ABS9KF56_9BACT|nr:ABC transporter ATP-binding protein [Rhodohalobacter sulfatireducens]MCG2589460.1 ABC transporter ATP-binding protein [Rhodohalobacter sulfatireducens]